MENLREKSALMGKSSINGGLISISMLMLQIIIQWEHEHMMILKKKT